MTFCREEITVESVTVLHTRELLNPKHCAWADLSDDHFKKGAKQGQLGLLLGDTYTLKGRKKATECNNLANNLEATLKSIIMDMPSAQSSRFITFCST